MVEATFGVVLLLFLALVAMQVSLVFHGSLAVHGAATRAARAAAVASPEAAQLAFDREMAGAPGRMTWSLGACTASGGLTRCTGRVTIPVVLPGAGLFGGGGPRDPIWVEATGAYPTRN